VGGVDAPVQDGAGVGGGVDLPHGQRAGERGDGVLAVGGEQGQVPAEGGIGGAVGDAWDQRLDGGVEVLTPGLAQDVHGGGREAVPVPGRGGRRVGGGVGEPAGRGAGRDLRLVAGQDLLQDVDRGQGVGDGGGDHRVLVAVAGDGQVDVVGGPAAGERDVQLLTGLFTGGDGVAGVGGDSLPAVHGGGVAQLDVLAHILARQGQVPTGVGVHDV